MDEKEEQKKEEQEKTKEPEAAPAESNTEDRLPTEKEEDSPDKIEEAKAVVKDLEAANDRKEKLLKKEEKLQADAMLSGKGQAGTMKIAPKKMSDTEYSEALERGEVNPLKEDGFI